MTSPADPWEPEYTQSGVPFGLLHSSECKQQFSLAYLHAIASAARCVLNVEDVDVDGVDLEIKQKVTKRKFVRSRVEVQLKCTSQSGVLKRDGLHWPLKRDHYNALVDTETIVHRILVVVKVPDNLSLALEHQVNKMVLSESAYWICLEGQPKLAPDIGQKTVVLAKAFNVEELLGILHRVGGGGTP